MVLFYLFSFAILTHELSLFPTVYFFFKRRVQTILSMIFYRGFAEIIKSIFLIKIILRILSNDQINRRSHDKTTSDNHIILKEEVLFVYQTVILCFDPSNYWNWVQNLRFSEPRLNIFQNIEYAEIIFCFL